MLGFNITKVIENRTEGSKLSATELQELSLKWSLFGSSIWYKKSFFFTEEKIIGGLNSGIAFSLTSVYFITGKDPSDFWSIKFENFVEDARIDGDLFIDLRNSKNIFRLTSEDLAVILAVKNQIKAFMRRNENYKTQIELDDEEKLYLNELQVQMKIELNKFELDDNENLQLIDPIDFDKLVQKHQKVIIDIDKSLIQNFIRLSAKLKTENLNITAIFHSLKCDYEERVDNFGGRTKEVVVRFPLSVENLPKRIELLRNLQNLIHSYDLMIFHAINMLNSAVSNDFVTFYEIYEMFDRIGIFNSNWENDISKKLSNIELKLDDVIDTMNRYESNMIRELKGLNYNLRSGFSELTKAVNIQLKEIDSSIKWNNLISSIQTYQLYKINIQTKRSRVQ